MGIRDHKAHKEL